MTLIQLLRALLVPYRILRVAFVVTQALLVDFGLTLSNMPLTSIIRLAPLVGHLRPSLWFLPINALRLHNLLSWILPPSDAWPLP